MTTTSDTCSMIRAAHRRRIFHMTQMTRITNALGAYLRMMMGFTPVMEKAEAEAVKKRVVEIVAAAQHGEVLDDSIYEENAPTIEATIASLKPHEENRKEMESIMDELARELPVWPWFRDNVFSSSAISLATIVGEAGEPSNYSTVGKLWKRMGLAVMKREDGTHVRQGGLPTSARAEEWVSHGYNKARRSRMFVIGDSLIKKQGPWRDLYLARKEHEIAKAAEAGLTVVPAAKIKRGDTTKIAQGAVHRRAQRYMEKRLLRDLWAAWRKAESCSGVEPPCSLTELRDAA